MLLTVLAQVQNTAHFLLYRDTTFVTWILLKFVLTMQLLY